MAPVTKLLRKRPGSVNSGQSEVFSLKAEISPKIPFFQKKEVVIMTKAFDIVLLRPGI
jgi:hypothetical protein